ncbi:ribulose-1,5 bisphosphate carboxylase/oxygenase large subunit N-methyltransferase, chloroplastic [Trifolium repens]|nr:ribulose-1,5 bisphosphate carboxylase/oxygenase large subunit N-methyltransferase, chloroplastic [Trifolium repens]
MKNTKKDDVQEGRGRSRTEIKAGRKTKADLIVVVKSKTARKSRFLCTSKSSSSKMFGFGRIVSNVAVCLRQNLSLRGGVQVRNINIGGGLGGEIPDSKRLSELYSLRELLSKYLIGNNLKKLVERDVVRLVGIQCYRGIRHADGLPCRGQRTHTNSRTRRTMRAVMDEECSIVLQLSENDPFFDEKKKLLQCKGFGPKERIYLRCSSGPHWMNDAVKILLPIARIIQLNELELYFAEDDASVEFYSPRNELEALNSIVLLTDKLLSSCQHSHTNILQGLRQTILDLISAFGDQNNLKGVPEKYHSCEKEEHLIEWGKSHGVKTQLKIAYVEGAGRGMIAEKDLKVGDIALEIPVSIIISEELVLETEMYRVLKEVDGISSETILLLWSMKEKYNCDSKFKSYFDSLPEKFNTGLSFGIEAITILDGTLLFEEIMQARQHLHAQYDELFPALCNGFPDIFPPEMYTWEKFLWACEIWYSNSMEIMFSDGELRTCLIPLAGFLNHSLCPHIMHYGKVDSSTNSLKFGLSRPCRSGEECCLSYGNFSSSHFITFYGFLPQGDNPYDVIPLDIDSSDIDSNEDKPVSNWATHMVRGTWLSNNHSIFYYGLPSPLLNHLRRSRSPVLKTKTLLQGNLENELEVLGDLKDIFDDMMDNMGDIDLDNSENYNWDEKLAVDFKNLQRRIAHSISTSCETGVSMLKNELHKCLAEDTLG